MQIKEIVLKVTSLCNLNCKYCYVYNKGDFSYKSEPKIISEEIVIATLKGIEKYCKLQQIEQFLIIFHGGEPLLVGKDFYKNFIRVSKEIVKSTELSFSLQTNATLLDEEWCALFNDLGIDFGSSLDGSELSNQNRVFRKDGLPAYDKILQGIRTINKYVGSSSILSVINIDENPEIVYNHFKSIGISSADFLFPDTTYDFPTQNVNLYGDWLIQLFECWYNDDNNSKLYVRSFEIIVNLFLGNETRGNEVFGIKYNSVISIKTNGNIEPVDSLKICNDGFTKTNLNILHNDIDEVFGIQLICKYHDAHQDLVLCEKCRTCVIKSICGGGQLAHRYSSVNGFDNPSIYCFQIFKFLVHVQNKIIDDLPIDLVSEINIQRLTLSDYKNC